MKAKGLTLTVSLMVTSILLLLALQGIWLHNSYEKAFFDFRREASGLFRTAVLAVRDSALFQHIESVPADSSYNRSNFLFTTLVDSDVVKTKSDTKAVDIKRSTSPQIQVFISSKARPDSIKAILQPFAARFSETNKNGVSRYVIRMDHDSLHTDSIKSHFARLSQSSRFQLPFEVKKSTSIPPFSDGRMIPPKFDAILGIDEDQSDQPIDIFTQSMTSEWVRVDPITRYAAILHDIRPALVKEIFPQLMFASFLSLVTILAFIFMYRSMRAQDRLIRLKNDFISNITHELKTPIATVSVALEAIDGFNAKDNPQATKEYLEIARSELNRLTQLTDKVLNTSLLDEKGFMGDLHSTDIGSMLTRILASMKPVFEKTGAKVHLDKEGTDFILMGNEFHLTHVIQNLLDNALKYSIQSPLIRVLLVNHHDQIRIVVKDHGIGIPLEYQNKIFEKFFRVPTGDIHNTKGHGLGLNYVAMVVREHGGYVELQSKPGEGSTFTIVLPKNH